MPLLLDFKTSMTRLRDYEVNGPKCIGPFKKNITVCKDLVSLKIFVPKQVVLKLQEVHFLIFMILKIFRQMSICIFSHKKVIELEILNILRITIHFGN